ncbi:hypothetical protein BDW72DRAFT_170466 [Aspergillus terricola var. indicus]
MASGGEPQNKEWCTIYLLGILSLAALFLVIQALHRLLYCTGWAWREGKGGPKITVTILHDAHHIKCRRPTALPSKGQDLGFFQARLTSSNRQFHNSPS